jgi:hypothetical protein
VKSLRLGQPGTPVNFFSITHPKFGLMHVGVHCHVVCRGALVAAELGVMEMKRKNVQEDL